MKRTLIAVVALIGLGSLTGCMGLTWPTGVHGPRMPCRPCGPSGPSGPSGTGPVLLSGAGALRDNAHDSYAAYGISLVSSTEDPVSIPVPSGGTLSNLRVKLATAPGAGASWTFTVDKNGRATALSCAIARAVKSCADASLVRVAVGDKLDLDVTPFGRPALATIAWSATLAHN